MSHWFVRVPLGVFVAVVGGLGSGAEMTAQDDSARSIAEPIAQLRDSNDPIDLELARRRLRILAMASIDDVVALLDCPREFARLAAVEALHAHGAAAGALLELAGTDPSPRVRAVLVGMHADPALTALCAPGGDVAVARAAFVELLRRDAVDAATLDAGLRRDEPDFLALVTRSLVERTWPWPALVVDSLPATGPAAQALLTALAARPRADSVRWLTRLLEIHSADAARAQRVSIYAAFPRGALSLDHARDLVEAGVGGEGVYADLLDAADRLDPAVADAIVADVHRVAVQRGQIGLALDVLRRASPRGLRHLASLSRVAPPDVQASIIEEIARRAPQLVTDIVRDALADQPPSRMEPYLLRRAGGLLTDPEWLEVVTTRVRNGTPEQRVAAFEALVSHGEIFDPVMLEHALATTDENDVRGRAAALLGLAPGVLPTAVWREFLQHGDARVRLRALQAVTTGSRAQIDELTDDLARLASPAGEPGMRVHALRVLLQCGEPAVVRAIWREAALEDRRATVVALRDRDEPWVTELLTDDPAHELVEFEFTRLCRGEREVLDALLADPSRWSRVWLRRASEPIARLLEPADLERLEQLAVGDRATDEDVRQSVVEWLELRPDLPSDTLLERMHARATDEIAREQILGQMVGRAAGARFRAELDEALGGPLDEDLQQLSYTVVGAMRPPLDLGQARLLARILLLSGLGDPRAEIGRVLDADAGDAAAGRVLLRMAMQSLRLPTVRRDADDAGSGDDSIEPTSDDDAAVAPLPPGIEAEFERVADEVLSSPRRHGLTRSRVGAILVEFARQPLTRGRVTPAVARVLLGLPDTDPTLVGPAELMLAEAAAAAEDWRAAADHYERASIALCATRPLPTVLRAFLPSPDPGSGIVPSASLRAAHWMCRARAARASGELDSAREFAARAVELALGDDTAHSAASSLLLELTR